MILSYPLFLSIFHEERVFKLTPKGRFEHQQILFPSLNVVNLRIFKQRFLYWKKVLLNFVQNTSYLKHSVK